MKNFTGLVILRAFMGAFEAACQPTFVILSGLWYRREEQGSVINLWSSLHRLPLREAELPRC